MNSRRRTLAWGGTCALIAVVSMWWLTMVWFRPVVSDPNDATVLIIDVKPGAALRTTAIKLEKHGIIVSARWLEWLGRLTGRAGRIQPGEYRMSSAMSASKVLNAMVKGEVYLRPVTFPEGITVRELIDKLVADGYGTKEEYEALLYNKALQAEFKVVADGVKVPFEGYLFPSTYLFARGTRPEVIVRAMLTQMDRMFTPERVAQMERLGWNRHQTLTMASIIEKETGVAHERARISAVFHNRLERRMRLQTDPTVIYSIPDYDGDIRFRDLRRDDPYNTYRHHGLPPGPIANPGEAAIQAALFPDGDQALYFVSRGDGTHIFSDNINDHNRAVRRHQK